MIETKCTVEALNVLLVIVLLFLIRKANNINIHMNKLYTPHFTPYFCGWSLL